MRLSPARLSVVILLQVVGIALAAAGIYVGETDDAPGAAGLGFLLMFGSFFLSYRAVRRSQRQPVV